MKPLVLCLFAVCCWCVAGASADMMKQRRKLMEVLRELDKVKRKLQKSEKMLSTPSENIEDCCCLSALECFRENFKEIFNLTDVTQRKLYRSLANPLTKKGLNFCDSQNSTCQDCHSHPEEKAGKFFDRLDSLIQKAIDKLSVYISSNQDIS